jgi:AraC-like DNA-binding protein
MGPHFYHATRAGSVETLNRAIPGARFDWVPDGGTTFSASFAHMLLEGIALTRLNLHQASYVTLGERIVNFNIWHAVGGQGRVNGGDPSDEVLALVRPGEGGTFHTTAPILVRSFALHPAAIAEGEVLGWPAILRRPPAAGRWRLPVPSTFQGFLARHDTVMHEIDQHPILMEHAATHRALHNTLADMIAGLGDAGVFQADRAAAGRHTQIMQRFEAIVRDASGTPMSLAEMCRLTGTSRRSLAAIVLERTGKPPGEYLRWRRLWQVRDLLTQPEVGMTVTEAAYRVGFWHLGRFAAAYAKAFGERPSRTLARGTETANRARRFGNR